MENSITAVEGEKLITRLNEFKITEECSTREIKSLIKDISLLENCPDKRNCTSSTSESDDDSLCHIFISLLKNQIKSLIVNDSLSTEQIANVMMFIRALAEVQYLPSSQEKKCQQKITLNNMDVCNVIFESILPDILDYIIETLNNQSTSASSIESTTALHQILAAMHKTLRTSLSILKRIDCGKRYSVDNTDIPEKSKYNSTLIEKKLGSFLELLCELMQCPPLASELDIKCSIGLGICLSVRVQYGESFFISFMENLFSRNPDISNNINIFVLNTILKVSSETVNSLSLAFGVLNVFGSDSDEHQIPIKLVKIIGENVLAIEHGTKEAISLGSARILETWSRTLLDLRPDFSFEFSHLFYEVEFFVFNYLSGHIDAVKSCCRNMITYLTKLYDNFENFKNNEEFTVKKFLERFISKPTHVKWVGLCWIARSSPRSICLLEMENELPLQLLLTERAFKNSATETYLSLMAYHFELTSLENWLKLWIAPLFVTHKTQASESNLSQKRTIICTVLKSKNELLRVAVLKYIVFQINSATLTSPEASQLAVESIKIATELGIKLDVLSVQNNLNEGGSYQGLIPRSLLNSWLWCGNPQVRLATFSLIVETKKTSEPLSLHDFNSLKLFLYYNLVSQNPAFRQQFLSYYKKLLKRLGDSFLLVKKKKDNEMLKNYHDFFQWLWKAFTSKLGLFPGANFGRRCQSLDCLAELLNHFDYKLLGVNNQNFEFLRWFNDSYENNKIMAFKILEKIPITESQSPQDLNICEELMQKAFNFCASVKPPESVTGKYLVVFLMTKFASLYSPIGVLERLYGKLTESLEKIQKTSLMEVSVKIAIYGYLSCIRMVFRESKDYLTDPITYREYSKKLVDLCFKLNESFFPLLGSAAPEGTLIDSIKEDNEELKSVVVRSLNAQKLLVCSWRSMRDACLLMTEICSLCPLEGEKDYYILSFIQVEAIGNHLLFLLKNLMHRGVFEQVFVGFKQLATRLHKSSSNKLNKLIEKWLEDALDEHIISSKSTTRRSAGLPFILQALLGPGCNNDAFMSKYINSLFERKSDSPEVRIHIMNVLRALFRDATFSKSIMPFVPAGLKLSFKAQGSNDWPEQNSGLMLLGATVRRCFGPKLNTMSASTFFRKFPDMYEFLLNEIRACSEKIKSDPTSNNRPSDFTFYVLVLLSSFATHGVVADAHFPLDSFVQCIRDCGASEDVRVRKVAAKAVLPFLIGTTNQAKLLNTVLKEWNVGIMTPFKVHGELLLVLAVLQVIPKEQRCHNLISKITNFLERYGLWESNFPLIYETLAEICFVIGEEARNGFNKVHLTFHETFEEISARHSVMDLPNADIKIFQAHIFFILSNSDNDKLEVVYCWTTKIDSLVFIEQVLTTLCSDHFSIFTKKRSSVVLHNLIQRYLEIDFKYKGQTTLEQLFLDIFIKIPVFVYDDWIHSCLDIDKLFNEVFEKVLYLCEVKMGTMTCKSKAVELIGKLSFQIDSQLTKDQKERVCIVLSSLCDAKNHDEIRLGTAKALPSLTEIQRFQKFTVNQQFLLWFTFIILSQDDESFVREEINSKFDDSTKGNICDVRLIEDLVQLCGNNFITYHKEEGLVLLIGLLLRDDYVVAEETDESEEERLFDKSEMNSFFEPLHLAKIIKKHLNENMSLKNDLKYVFQNIRLDKHLTDLYEFVSNTEIHSQEKGIEITLQNLCSFENNSVNEITRVNLSYFSQSEMFCVQNAVRNFIKDIFS